MDKATKNSAIEKNVASEQTEVTKRAEEQEIPDPPTPPPPFNITEEIGESVTIDDSND